MVDRLIAVIHVLVWLSFVVRAQPGVDPTTHLISAMLLLAPLLLVRWGTELVDGTSAEALGRAGWAVPAWAVALSLTLPAGAIAGVLALPWLGVAVWLAYRMVPAGLGQWRQLENLTVLAASLFLVVGCGWLVTSRLGLRPLGLESVIVLLTAVHFHFAGFCALVIISRLHRLTPPAVLGIYRWTALGAVLGTPLLAAGITLSPLLELLGAAVLAGSLLLLAGLLLFVIIPSLDRWPAQTLLGAAAAFLALGMVLAAGYGVAQFERLLILPIPQMAALHGIANGFGFAGLGLAGLKLLED